MRGEEYKCRVSKMHLKLRDQQLKTSTYLTRLLYKNLTVTTKQNPVIEIHTKKKGMQNNTKDSHQIRREENKRRKGKKRPTKTNPKQLAKRQ